MIDINELRQRLEEDGKRNIDLGEIHELLDRLEAAESEAIEQARLNGMGSEREAALMAKLEAAERNLGCCRAEREEAASLFLSVKAKLIGECDALRAELAQLHKEADKFGDGIDWIQRALQAEAQIEAMGRQAPVAWMNSRNGFICKENKNPDYNVPLKHIDLGAQGEEK